MNDISNEAILNIQVKAVKIIKLRNKSHWVHSVPDCLPKGEDVELIFVDKNGNTCHSGVDFSSAEEKQSYPVTVYRLINVALQPHKEGDIRNHILETNIPSRKEYSAVLRFNTKTEGQTIVNMFSLEATTPNELYDHISECADIYTTHLNKQEFWNE